MTFRTTRLTLLLAACAVAPSGAALRSGTALAAKTMVLRSGAATLELARKAGDGYGIRVLLRSGTVSRTVAQQGSPLAVEVVNSLGKAAWLSGAYDSVSPSVGSLACRGSVRTPNGTVFRFTDSYAALPGAASFRMSRRVDVETPDPRDRGFSTRFALAGPAPSPTRAFDYLVPGVWYQQNAHVPPTALACTMDSSNMLIRDDRMALPLVMARDRRDGTTLSLLRMGSPSTTFTGEDGLNRLIDGRLQFASLGIHVTDRPELTVQYPGTEGDRTYIYGGSTTPRWALRSHPVQTGVRHAYQVVIRATSTPDYPEAVRGTWRAAFALYRPPVFRADIPRIYAEEITLLAAYEQPFQGVPGLPFSVRVPDGSVEHVSFQMGFVGQQIPAGYHMLRYGLRHSDADLTARGEAIVDFWAKNSLTPEGLPRTWYDVEGHIGWRDYPTYLRVACDGMEGALSAWREEQRAGRDRPEWLTFARRFGDWLVAHQNVDGSWFRAFNFDGSAREATKYNTTHPIPFMVRLYEATHDARYRDAALRAGAYCRANIHATYDYVGGTPDNPDVMDKEAGVKALQAFLALYDLTGDKEWLAPAAQAATFCETWLVCWNVPPPADDPASDLPKGRTTHGLSLIATGHSGVDTFLAGQAYDFYRLYRLTGDPHDLDVARILLNDTKQLLDADGTLGYAHNALQVEAMALSLLRGHSVKVWLPWLTVAQIEPLTRLEDAYGSMDIDSLSGKRPARRTRSR